MGVIGSADTGLAHSGDILLIPEVAVELRSLFGVERFAKNLTDLCLGLIAIEIRADNGVDDQGVDDVETVVYATSLEVDALPERLAPDVAPVRRGPLRRSDRDWVGTFSAR